ncbi:unnamed protein product [Sphagnum jensenii]|uniref:Uncharacterized protein n=2 Tax=Sphagnum jensenii TaxID=128206 RepID=A0ABP1AQT5_9BRYO
MVWGGFWAGEQGLMSNGSAAAAHKPPSLLHLSISTAVSNIQRLSNLSCIPDNIVKDLFVGTLDAGKLTEPVLHMFLATGNEEVLHIVQGLGIRPILKPVLPTRCSQK